MGKYLGTEQTLVYLDQCVVSRFLPRPTNVAWQEVCKLLRDGVSKGKITCPSSLEHMVETAALPDSEAMQLGRIISDLSRGWSLKLESELAAQQIVGRLRAIAVTREAFLTQGLLRPLDNDAALRHLRMLRAKTDNHNEWLMRGVNRVTGWAGGGPRGKSMTWQWMKTRRRLTILTTLVEAIERSVRTGRIVVEADAHAAELARWETVIAYHMITAHQMAAPEAVQLLRLLREDGLDFCPLLAVKADLSALQHANREIIEPRDQYDITRAACALPYADIYITDGGKAAAIRELKLDQKYGTEVFSTKTVEVGAFRQRLEILLSHA